MATEQTDLLDAVPSQRLSLLPGAPNASDECDIAALLVNLRANTDYSPSRRPSKSEPMPVQTPSPVLVKVHVDDQDETSQFELADMDQEEEDQEPEEDIEEEEVEDFEDDLDDEDDEWVESERVVSPSTTNSGQRNQQNRTGPRKKAPSGTACDKHKVTTSVVTLSCAQRWKKRCPDDCPMRKLKRPQPPAVRSRSDSGSDSAEEAPEENNSGSRRKDAARRPKDSRQSPVRGRRAVPPDSNVTSPTASPTTLPRTPAKRKGIATIAVSSDSS